MVDLNDQCYSEPAEGDEPSTSQKSKIFIVPALLFLLAHGAIHGMQMERDLSPPLQSVKKGL